MMRKEENNFTSIPLHSLKQSELISLTTNQSRIASVDKKVTSININFTDISYSVNSWTRPANNIPTKREKKQILNGISGNFQAFELTGIIGPSGSGKSSLLDILSGYSTNYTGQILHNGCRRSGKQLARHSVYIMQDCSLQPLLTVQEAMFVAAQLKMGRHHSVQQRLAVVMDILHTLELTHKSESMTKTLSGGELKRLAIALELIDKPPIMFFDEPTSGLDYHVAKKCLVHLKKLANAGHNIICTLHQPSALLFDQLDHVYVIADGRCVYQGSNRGLTDFLDDLGLSCPKYHNPADHVIDVSAGEFGECLDQMVDKVNNGKSYKWRGHVVQPNDGPNVEVSQPNKCKVLKDDALQCSSFITQVSVLLLTAFTKTYRHKVLTYMRFAIHCVVGTLLGIFYYGVGSDASYAMDNFRLLFFSLMFLMFTAFSSMIMSFPLEMPILVREHFNRWYSLKSYYLALTLSDTPVQVLCILAYCGIVYTISRQPLEMFRFGMFVLMCLAVSMFTQAIGVLLGCSMNITHGMIVGPFLIMPWLIFSGFFVLMTDAPSFLHWLFHISFLKYSTEGLMLAIYGYDREKMPCSDDYCHFRLPKKFLKELKMSEASYEASLAFIFGLYLSTKILTYFVLRYQINHKR